MTWSYNAKTHRWEATTFGYQMIAQRARNGHDWEAAIERLADGTRVESAVVFPSSDAARDWCASMLVQQRRSDGSVSPVSPEDIS
jgi:hypothetical protein